MFIVCDEDNQTELILDEDDICVDCKHAPHCPLIKALECKYMFMRYEGMIIEHCDLFKG